MAAAILGPASSVLLEPRVAHAVLQWCRNQGGGRQHIKEVSTAEREAIKTLVHLHLAGWRSGNPQCGGRNAPSTAHQASSPSSQLDWSASVPSSSCSKGTRSTQPFPSCSCSEFVSFPLPSLLPKTLLGSQPELGVGDQRYGSAPADGTTALEIKAFRTKLLASLREDIGDIIKSEIRSVLEKEMMGFRADINMREVAHLKPQSKLLENKCEDLEARARRNNIRIVGVPESQASSTRAISALLQKAFNLTEAPMLDREKQRIKMDGMTISVYPDYTARVARAQSGYNGVRQQLCGVEGVRYGILYPARFRITHNNQEWIFSTPEAAQSYIRENISVNRSPVRD
ncbi:hypothetical protein AOLI_G00063050 [Acnodon oligacanthus]